MALTAEQQAQMEAQMAAQAAAEANRHANQMALEAKRAKLEMVRMAKETLLENARSKPADSRDVTAADITAFAQTLVNYIDA
jgi:vacuolar-type H+-ATPase subunit E/Vma4